MHVPGACHCAVHLDMFSFVAAMAGAAQSWNLGSQQHSAAGVQLNAITRSSSSVPEDPLANFPSRFNFFSTNQQESRIDDASPLQSTLQTMWHFSCVTVSMCAARCRPPQ